MDTYADDLAALIEALDLRDVVLVGHSTGGGEVTRYIGRHGTDRVAKVVLRRRDPAADAQDRRPTRRAADRGLRRHPRRLSADRSQFYKDLSAPFYGANRPGSKVSQGLRDSSGCWSMQVGLKGAYDCIKAFSETDLTEDLQEDRRADADHPRRRRPDRADRRLGPPVVEDRQGRDAEGLPGRTRTACQRRHKDQFNADLLAFLR